MTSFERITTHPARMNGQPCIRDLRITVRRVLELVATYPNRAALFADFPELVEDDVREALAYAAASIDDEVIELPHAG